MSDAKALVDALFAGDSLPEEKLAFLLGMSDPDSVDYLHSKANELKHRLIGNKVYLRGLVEFSNVCSCDCLYCGIRKSNDSVHRYTMSVDEVLAGASQALDADFGSVVLQSGERSDENFVDLVEKMILAIKNKYPDCGITISCGEESLDVYRRWHDAGAERYLLRIETTNQKLFQDIHDAKSLYSKRLQALHDLQEAGFITGSGVMIALPGQTLSDLARDLIFFRDMDLDMIGMGPFIPHPATPLGASFKDDDSSRRQRVILSLNMIALARLLLRDVNIASTTALQTLDPSRGIVSGILAGANVIMPNVGEKTLRKDYLLYAGKPVSDIDAKQAKAKLTELLAAAGEEIAVGTPGHPAHYLRRIRQ